MSVNLTEKQKELIESFGVIQKRMGLTPAFARVNALLTICDETELTFEQIQDGLNLSKSATSNALQGLLAIDRIGYKTKPGERKRYFFSKLDQWRIIFKKDVLSLGHYVDLLKEIHLNRTKNTPEYNDKLKELTEFMDYFITETVNITEKWEVK